MTTKHERLSMIAQALDVGVDVDEGEADVHEAGHVVIARLHGIPIEAVCSFGDHGAAIYTSEIVEADGRRTKIEAHAHAQLLLGGAAAETIARDERVISVGCASDLLGAYRVLKMYPLDERLEVMSELFNDAQVMLDAVWSVVERVADDLFERGCLNERRVTKLLENPDARN